MKKISDMFDISYGSKLDFNKLEKCAKPDSSCIYFVSRTSRNLGIIAQVKEVKGKKPFQAGLITVTLGGTYVLSAFVQPKRFYTAQNVMVLIPKQDMSFEEKVYYCLCISRNRFKYSAFGREANRTLKNLELPATIPEFVKDANLGQSVKGKITETILNIANETTN